MNQLKYSSILIAVCLSLIAFGLFIYIQRQQPPVDTPEMPVGQTHSVVLTSDGYVPQTLTINQNDVVEFSTLRGFEHWPASNIHPTHNQYPAFDSRGPVSASETWSFQFTEVGTWPFHDHLNATYTGVITVVAP